MYVWLSIDVGRLMLMGEHMTAWGLVMARSCPKHIAPCSWLPNLTLVCGLVLWLL